MLSGTAINEAVLGALFAAIGCCPNDRIELVSPTIINKNRKEVNGYNVLNTTKRLVKNIFGFTHFYLIRLSYLELHPNENLQFFP